jgi:hypothetical protein
MLNDNDTAISQRDQNHYDFLNEEASQTKVVDTILAIWDSKIRHAWDVTRDCKRLTPPALRCELIML